MATTYVRIARPARLSRSTDLSRSTASRTLSIGLWTLQVLLTTWSSRGVPRDSAVIGFGLPSIPSTGVCSGWSFLLLTSRSSRPSPHRERPRLWALLLATGSQGGAEWVGRGTDLGDRPGRPATGKSFEFRGASIFEFANGKIRRCSDYRDRVSQLKQLGLMPAG